MKRLMASAAMAGTMACGVLGCVARGTLVRTPRGHRRIEELEIGDAVSSVDPSTGELVTTRVSATRSVHRECVRLATGSGELVLTSDHPVYCPQTGTWAPAGDWVLGKRTHLLRVDEQGAVAVEVLERLAYAGIFEVFDITVEHSLHNFLANGVLVHNKSPIEPQCPLPDGGLVYPGEFCTCPGGQPGTFECVTVDGPTHCQGCPGDLADGGADGGIGHGGPDGGTTDAGTEDGGTGDSGVDGGNG